MFPIVLKFISETKIVISLDLRNYSGSIQYCLHNKKNQVTIREFFYSGIFVIVTFVGSLLFVS